MANNRVRRIYPVNPSGAWADPWLDFEPIIKWAVRFGQHVLAWSWLAGLLGSVIWISSFFLGLEFPLAQDTVTFLHLHLNISTNQLWIIVLVLFLHTTLGLLAAYRHILPTSGLWGLAIVCTGLLWTTLGLWETSGTGIFGLLKVFQINQEQGTFDGILHILTSVGPHYPQFDWFAGRSIPFYTISIGLILFYAAAIKSRLISTGKGLSLSIIAIGIHIPGIIVGIRTADPHLFYTFLETGVFASVFMLFGANWLLAGIALLQHQRKTKWQAAE